MGKSPSELLTDPNYTMNDWQIDMACMAAADVERAKMAKRWKPPRVQAHVCYALDAAMFLAAMLED